MKGFIQLAALAVIGGMLVVGGFFLRAFDKPEEVTLGGPSINYSRSIIPIDSTENVGTTTAPWDEGHFNEICLTADCKTAWPTGGGGGAGTFATTTSTVSGQLINYPLNATDIVVIGSNATTTGEFWFDPNLPRSYLRPNVGIGTTTPYAPLSVVGEIVGGYFTSTTTATSTFGGDINLSRNHSVIVAHSFIADETDGLRLENNARGLVALLGAGNGLGATFYDGVNVTGALSVLGTSLATFPYSSSTIYSSFITASTTKLIIGGDELTELAGTGLTVSSNQLQSTLGTSISASEIADGDHGDFTYTTGVAAIDANAVALGTDTVNNYVATIADAGNTTITVANSGTETAAVTLDVVDLNCTNCIGDTEISTHAGTSLAADLEEEVTEGSLANDTIVEADLKIVDAGIDEDILTRETTTGDFEWHTCAEITGSADLCDGNDASGGGASFGQVFELYNGNTIAATTTSHSLVVGGNNLQGSNALFGVFATSTTGNLIYASSTASFAGNFLQFENSAGTELFAVSSAGAISTRSVGTAAMADADHGDISWSSGTASVDANSVALTTDTTGNYAAGDAEAGNALTGDSATSFFSSGVLELGIGGTNNTAYSLNSLLFYDGTRITGTSSQPLYIGSFVATTTATSTIAGNLDLVGDIDAGQLFLTDNATSTAVNGFNLTGGCFAVNNVCVNDLFVRKTGDTMTGSLTFSAVTTDITTGTNEHLNLSPNGTGKVGVASTSPVTLLGISGTTTTQTLNIDHPTHTGTSTIYVSSRTAGFGGEIVLEDTDGAGCTSIAALNGTLYSKTVTCPADPTY